VASLFFKVTSLPHFALGHFTLKTLLPLRTLLGTRNFVPQLVHFNRRSFPAGWAFLLADG
jgi:hypothetical protein